jgi:hypothetical protein
VGSKNTNKKEGGKVSLKMSPKNILQHVGLWLVSFWFLAACVPLPPETTVAPDPKGIEMSVPPSQNQLHSLVPAAEMPVESVVADTLVLALVDEGSEAGPLTANQQLLVIGPRSAFPSLPSNAVAILEPSQVPSGVSSIGKSDLHIFSIPAPDEVVVISPGDIVDWLPDSNNDGLNVQLRPSSLGILSSENAISTTIPFTTEVDLQFPKNPPPVQCVEDDPWHCLLCVVFPKLCQ